MRSLFQPVFVLTLIGAPLHAEFLHVELTIGGLDCISCAQSVDKVLKKIKGVETASFRTQDSVAVLDLKAGNTTPIEQIRDAVKGIGYTPKAARVTVRGQAREEGGRWTLQVAGAEYQLDVTGVRPVDGAVLVEGTIAEPAAPLKVSVMRRE